MSPKMAVISSSVVLSMAILITIFPWLTDFSSISNSSLLSNFSILLNHPPYLYIFVNLIIISIVASSKLHNSSQLHHHAGDDEDDHHVYDDITTTTTVVYTEEDDHDDRVVEMETEHDRLVENVDDVAVREPSDDEGMEMDGGDGIMKGVVKIDPMEIRVMDEKLEALKQKVKEIEKDRPRPLSSTRFHRNQQVKADGGKSLRVVSKPKRGDTLESTWRTITDGRSMPLSRHNKKADTLDAPLHASNDQLSLHVKNSDQTLFNTNSSSLIKREPSVKLKKDPSLSQDELNRRVEAFIDKFNEEMRLQRQQSLMNQEMLKRGVIQY